MLFNSAAFVLLSALSSVLAAPSGNHTVPRSCGTQKSAEAIIAAEKDFHERLSQGPLGVLAATIQVYWHVIRSGTTLAEGNVPASQITANIAAMNKHYASCGLSFKLASTTRTTNANWFNTVEKGNSAQTAMKKKLRKGGAAALNVYTVGFKSGDPNSLGYATFPSEYQGNPKDDGVVIVYSSLPGGTRANYNQGKTLTHETGHWVGLYHVFEGGCSGSGDMVADTPPQVTETSGCPSNQDSCPGGGKDSVHNYMDYSYDSCMTQFTSGQCARMKSQLRTYRGVSI